MGTAKLHASDTVVDRILVLEGQLSRAPVKGALRKRLTKAISVEADLYRKSLDVEQAHEVFDATTAPRRTPAP